jgi:hypothetical protein
MFRLASSLLLLLSSSVAFPVVQVPLAIEATVPASQLDTFTAGSLPWGLPSHGELLESSSMYLSASSSTTTTTPTSAPAPAPTSTKPSANLANSAKPLAITDIFFDGKVKQTEADEYVVLTNQSKNPIDISGDHIYVATTGTQGPTFAFPKGSTLKPGQSVRVYTNEIHKETGGYSFGSGKAIWNNKGGLAVLKDGKGQKLGEYKYKGSS